MTDKIIGHSGHFIDHGDGTVTDTRSGLMWMRPAVGQTWENGKCKGEALPLLWNDGEAWQAFENDAKPLRCDFANYLDWRLPTIDELKNLVYPGMNPALDEQAFPAQSGRYFWTSSRSDARSPVEYLNQPIIFALRSGVLGYSANDSQREHVRLVRFKQVSSGLHTGFNPINLEVRIDSDKLVDDERGEDLYENMDSIWLDVHSTGNGKGTISRSFHKVNYAYGSTVTLTAIAEDCSVFVRWHGDAGGSSDVNTVTMTSAKLIQAEFAKLKILVVSPIGTGSGFITCNPEGKKYVPGKVVTLNALASAGSRFKCWHGAVTGQDATCEVTMNSNKAISAEFTKLEYVELKLMSTGVGSGVIARRPEDEKYPLGSIVKLTACPAQGSIFVCWHGDFHSADADCTVTMDSAKSILAEFAEVETFALFVTTTGIGRGQITRNLNAEKYIHGAEVILTASALEGSRFNGWQGDIWPADGMDSVLNVTMDFAKNVSADFVELDSCILNVNIAGAGVGVVTRSPDADKHYRGSTVVLTAQAAIGSMFSGWHGDASGVDDSCTVKMSSAKSITAQFEKVCFDDLGIAVEFESAKPATMVDGDAVIIFYLNIRNKGERQVRVTLPLATYISRIGEEIEQDVWLSGMVIGAEGSTIRAGAFRKTGLVFLKSRLSAVAKGECLFVTVEQTKPPMTMHFTFRCKDAGLSAFELIKATAVDKHTAEEDAENLSAMALIVQRLDFLESGFTEVLRKLDALQDGRLLPFGDATVRSPPAQTLPDVLRWLSTQICISIADLRTKLLPLDLLPSAVIDDINERALDLTGVVALEDDGTTVAVQQDVLLEVIAQWQG